MNWLRQFGSALLLVVCSAGVAHACPVCPSEIGGQVRAGIFNAEFGSNLLMTLLPFPIVMGIAAALHFGFSSRGTPIETR